MVEKLPKHLEHIAKALSECSENRQNAIKVKDYESQKYWSEVHRVLVYACRDIQNLTFKLWK